MPWKQVFPEHLEVSFEDPLCQDIEVFISHMECAENGAELVAVLHGPLWKMLII